MLAHGTVGDAGGRSTERPYVRDAIWRYVILAHGTVGDAGGRSTERPYVRRTILRHVILVLTDVAMDAARAGGERDGVLSGVSVRKEPT